MNDDPHRSRAMDAGEGLKVTPLPTVAIQVDRNEIASWDPYEVWVRRVKLPRESAPPRSAPPTIGPRAVVGKLDETLDRKPSLLAPRAG